ncbi:MAG: LamG-like jellyroll fold domain-containing protein, partial [Bacteroidota bacterium]
MRRLLRNSIFHFFSWLVIGLSAIPLQAQYDVSTATFTFQGGNPLRIDTQETMPEGIAFSTDGFKMFIVGAEDAEVNQYNLVTAFDITTAAFETNYSVIAQETDPKDITFSTDGQTMFVLGVENVHQYALNIPFDITTGTSLTTSFSIAAQENQANGVRFSSDGLKMFITGFQRRAVLQYDLSGTFDLTGLTSFTALFSSSGQLNSPHGITFSGDGLKMFLHDGSNSELDEFSLSAAFSLTSTISFITSVSITAGTRDFVFSDDGSRLFVTSQGFSIAPEVSAYDLSAAFDISSSLSLTNQVGNPFPATHAQGLEFSPDGLHMFTSGDIAEQYDLSLPYDLSTATSSGNSISLPSPSIITSRPVRRPGRAIRFSNDGLKMFTVAWGGSSVVFGTAYVDPIISQHSLLLPYDLSTAALDLTLSLSGTPENALEGLAFSSDGLKMFVIGEQLNQVDQYRLFTAFDITGGVTYEASFSVSAQESESSGIEFSDDGIFMFITGSDGQDINQYKLTTPFDISSGVTFTTSFSVATEESSPRDIDFSDDGLKMFIIGDDIEEINQYDLSPNANINLVSPPSPAFGLVDVGTSATLTYTIENTGLGTLNITNIISDNSPPLSIQNAPTSIAAGASATFEVVFVPTVAGFESASITINSNAFNSPVLSFSVSGTSGQEATALDFDGSNDHVTLPNGITNAITGNTITLEAWVNLDAIRGSDVNSGVGIINEVSNSRVRYAIYMGGSQSGQQRIYAGFFDGSWRVASTTIPLNEWKHIASSYDGSVIRIYIDGAEVASTIVNRSLPSNGPDQWRIGRRWDGVANSSRVMAGQIDEVRIWNDVRTCAEILTYKDTELTGNESDLVAYYNFNQGLVNVDNAGITTLPDLGPNGFNGTLSNFTLNGTTSNWVDGFSNGVLPNNTSPQPEIEVVPLTGTNFGTLNLGQSATLSFQITNSGSGTLTISDITSSITPTFTIQNAPSGVAAGATATFEVLFSATPAGEYLANITIESNDCDEPSFTFSVSGTAEQDATALDFDGSDDSVILPSAINNQITGNTITVEAWANVTQIKGSSTTSGVGIITEGANGSVKYSIFLSGSQGEDQRITAGFFNGTWRTATSSIPLDEWKHLASSYDGTTIRLYIDGVEMATTSYTTSSLPTNNPDVWIVGRRWDGAATSANVMRGQIDEIRIWNDVRTCSEILTYKDAELTGTEDDLVAYYNFNQGLVNQDNSSETTLTDLSPNNFNGTLQRFTLAGTTSNWADGTANGVMTGGESLQP